MAAQVTILVKNGNYKNLVRDFLLSSGLELVGENYTHGGREIHFRIPATLTAPKVDDAQPS